LTAFLPQSGNYEAKKKPNACAAGGRGDPCTRYQENREIARTRFRSQVREDHHDYFLTEPESEMLYSTFRA
jgi:hypothetical protein